MYKQLNSEKGFPFSPIVFHKSFFPESERTGPPGPSDGGRPHSIARALSGLREGASEAGTGGCGDMTDVDESAVNKLEIASFRRIRQSTRCQQNLKGAVEAAAAVGGQQESGWRSRLIRTSVSDSW